jgi:hypothetical protein
MTAFLWSLQSSTFNGKEYSYHFYIDSGLTTVACVKYVIVIIWYSCVSNRWGIQQERIGNILSELYRNCFQVFQATK